MLRSSRRDDGDTARAADPGLAFTLAALTDVACAAAGYTTPRWLSKTLLMPLLARRRDRRTARALRLGWAGDVALLVYDRTGTRAFFTLGLASFLSGHIAWITALRERPSAHLLKKKPLLALPYIVAWAALNRYLWPVSGRDRLPVLAYSCALVAMSLTALDSGHGETIAGGALFMGSDTLLALEKFADRKIAGHEGIVMATYAAAQALLARNSFQQRTTTVPIPPGPRCAATTGLNSAT